MSDESVHAALRSNAQLVVIEAPGGCGKTYQGAAYARDTAAALESGRLLILTHTHAACSVFDSRTRGSGSRVEIKTIDSLIGQIAGAYHAGLGLPKDLATWARQTNDGYDLLAVKAAALLKRYPAIARAIACRYPVIICDEHQDSTGERHAAIMALHTQGAKLRVFADPMQTVFTAKAHIGGCPPLDWSALCGQAQTFEQLDTPHRWANGCPNLGRWILTARDALKRGDKIDLRNGVPDSVTIVRANNIAQQNLVFMPAPGDRGPIDAFANNPQSLLILTRNNKTATGLRPAFNRRFPLWEGHNRSDLETLVDNLSSANGDKVAVAAAVIVFVQSTCVGFSGAAFADNLLADVADGCTRRRSKKAAKIQELARLVVAEPDHHGAGKLLSRVAELRATDADFRSIQIDAVKEFYEGCRLKDFTTADAGFAEISQRRTYSRPSPAPKAISTIHKAKGLECDRVIIAPCDAATFRDDQISRCLLYVAISRPMKRLMFVVPRVNPSPLILV